MNIIEKYFIDNSDIISFDVFDTLVKRNCRVPEDVFRIVEYKYNSSHKNQITDFVSLRKVAEERARQRNISHETTIEMIYKELAVEDALELMRMEIETEKMICVSNPQIRELYDYCVKTKKKLICTSDMYLTKDIIRSILQNCGYSEIEDIYVSSEYLKSKHIGNLYKVIRSKTKGKIFHIGDNWRSDFISPILFGVKSCIIPRLWYKKKDKSVKLLQNDIIDSIVRNNVVHDEIESLGFDTIGPFVAGFCQWIHKVFIHEKKKNICFCARDMYLVNNAYNKLFGDKNSKYLYVSRKSIALPYLYKNNSFERFIECVPEGKFNLYDYLKSIGVVMHQYPFGLYTEVSKDILGKENLYREFYDSELKPIISGKTGKDAYEYFLKYMNSIGFDPMNSLLVDVGWRGTTQYFLENIYNAKITGAYIGLRQNRWEGLDNSKIYTYLFDAVKNKRPDYEIKLYSFTTLFEMLLSGEHGSTVAYDSKGPVLEHGGHSEYIHKMQLKALEFIDELKKLSLYDLMPIQGIEYADKIINIGINPTYNQTRIFGDIKNDDFGITYFAKPQSLLHYVRKPVDIKIDLSKSKWKIGFLKRILKIKLPYYRVYKLLKG